MGFLKKVWGGIKDVAQNAYDGTINKAGDAVGDLLNGHSGSSTTPSNHDKAVQSVVSAFIAEWKKTNPYTLLTAPKATAAAADYVKSKDGQAAVAKAEAALNAGGNTQSTAFGDMLKGLLSSAVEGIKGGVKTGLSNSVGSALATAINKGTGSLFGSKPIKSAQSTIAAFGAQTLGKTIIEFLKKYWYLTIIPFGLVTLVIIKLLQSIFKRNGRKAKGKSTVRTR